MKRIQQLKIKNFKAFQEEEIFDFKGKNVLVYGNNGSGKSSLFWALYTFLQSSIKPRDEEIEKYFKYFSETDSSTHQSLLNVFIDESESSHIEMTYIDEDTQETHTNIISKDTINTRANEVIQELTEGSDFINYKLLHNFYNASHRQEVNLWSVFERDIFPFLIENTKPILTKIKEKTQPISGSHTQPRKRRKNEEIDDINLEIDGKLLEIETNANTFLKEHFNNGEDIIKLELKFINQFTFDNVHKNLWDESNDSIRHSNLHIKLMVKVYDDATESWKNIHRVQSFLNEAQLTRIAISIRIGALRARVQGTSFKILALDDMLNSLDMANRVDVIRIILNKENKPNLSYFDDFQKIILTHDKGFFDIIQRHTDDEDWVYYKFTKDETKNIAPKVKKELTHRQKAQKYFDDDELEACGNELRKEAEAIFTNFLDPEMNKLKGEFEALSKKIEKAYNIQLNTKQQKFQKIFLKNELELEKIQKIDTDIDSNPDLSEPEKIKLKALRQKLYEFLYETVKDRDNKEKHIRQTKEILDRVLNSASHHTDNPLYRDELKEAINHMVSLKTVLEIN